MTISVGDTAHMGVRAIEETTFGALPTTPAMQDLRIKSQSLNYALKTVTSASIRVDRMVDDVIQVDADVTGALDFELSYGAADEFIAGVLFSSWVKSLEFNTLTQITNVTGTSTFTVASGGAAFVAGHMIQTSGFTSAANNATLQVASSTATTVVTTASTLVAEAALAGSKIKVVGFISAAAADIKAAISPTRLTSTTTNFTTFGLSVGMWVKLGGTLTTSKFATAANNGYCRISAITASALTFDIVPTGFAVDAAAGVSLKVWFGDQLRNGVTRRSWSIERAHTDVSQYFLYSGCVMSQADFKMATGSILTASIQVLGLTLTPGSATNANSVIASTAGAVLNSVSDVAQLMVGGTSQGIIQSLNVTVNNTLRGQKAVATLGNAGVGSGQFMTSGTITAYFQDASLYSNFFIANVATTLSIAWQKNNQALILHCPKIKLDSCTINAGAINTDVTLQFGFKGIRDTSLIFQAGFDRMPYMEA